MWKTINEFPNYEVSDRGEVRNISRGAVLKTQLDICGYKVLQLYKNNKRWYKRVHRLVAESFVENPNNLPEVNHKDTDKTNNNDWNLEWVTQYENLEHARVNKLLCKQSRPVVQYTLEDVLMKEHESITDAAKSVNRTPASVRACCIGVTNTSAGYKWRFKDVN